MAKGVINLPIVAVILAIVLIGGYFYTQGKLPFIQQSVTPTDGNMGSVCASDSDCLSGLKCLSSSSSLSVVTYSVPVGTNCKYSNINCPTTVSGSGARYDNYPVQYCQVVAGDGSTSTGSCSLPATLSPGQTYLSTHSSCSSLSGTTKGCTVTAYFTGKTCQGVPVSVCGNNILESGEQCDPPGRNIDTSDGLGYQVCQSNCQLGPIQYYQNVCGNNICEQGENAINCDADCNPICGNLFIEPPEQCETGQNQSCTINSIPGQQSCTSSCSWGTCQQTGSCIPGTIASCGDCGKKICQSNGQYGNCEPQSTCGTNLECVGTPSTSYNCQEKPVSITVYSDQFYPTNVPFTINASITNINTQTTVTGAIYDQNNIVISQAFVSPPFSGNLWTFSFSGVATSGTYTMKISVPSRNTVQPTSVSFRPQLVMTTLLEGGFTHSSSEDLKVKLNIQPLGCDRTSKSVTVMVQGIFGFTPVQTTYQFGPPTGLYECDLIIPKNQLQPGTYNIIVSASDATSQRLYDSVTKTVSGVLIQQAAIQISAVDIQPGRSNIPKGTPVTIKITISPNVELSQLAIEIKTPSTQIETFRLTDTNSGITHSAGIPIYTKTYVPQLGGQYFVKIYDAKYSSWAPGSWEDNFVTEGPTTENCNNGRDDNGDGLIDGQDPQCKPICDGIQLGSQCFAWTGIIIVLILLMVVGVIFYFQFLRK